MIKFVYCWFFEISKVKLWGWKKIKIPIGIDSNGDMVYVSIMELDQRFNPINNRKLAVIQAEIIKEACMKLAKQKGSTVF